MHLAVGEVERVDQIVGDAARRQLAQNDEIPGTIGIGEPAPDRPAGPDDRGQRALLVGVGGQEVVGGIGDLDAGLGLPEEAPAHDVRVQGAHEHRDPVERQAGRDQAPAELGQEILRLADPVRAIDQPVDHRLDGARAISARSVGHGRHRLALGARRRQRIGLPIS